MDSIEKLDEIMLDFYKGSGQNDISELYKSIEFFSDGQKKVYNLLRTLQIKYDLPKLEILLDDLVDVEKANRKNRHMRKLLEFYSLAKHFRGLKLQGNSGDEEK
ncbi:MAG: hypothetical protein GX367_03265 [Bacteroidales bacterium]|jgi:hypothetical protein|nr:hypothetical protein [Bacteroidales bacterium]